MKLSKERKGTDGRKGHEVGSNNRVTRVGLKYTAYFYENIHTVPVHRHNENNFLIL